MARARFQEGSLAKIGDKWVARYRVYDSLGKVTNKKETIGLVSQMSKREANQKKQEIVSRGTQQLPKTPDMANRGEMLFQVFYKERFLPLKTNWSEATRDKNVYFIEKFVLPKFGHIALNQIDKVMVQTWLNNGSLNFKLSTVRKMKEYVSSILGEAFEQEFITRNPARKTVMPKNAAAPDHATLTHQQLIALIDKVTDARDKALFLVGTFCAMRTSEIFGLSWKHFHHNPEGASLLMIDQIAYKGKIMQQTKTLDSKAPVPVVGNTLKWLLRWMKECKDTSPDALIFQSTNKNGRSKKGAPMCGGIWMQKRIWPLAKALGIDVKVNFRMTRRTAATHMQGESPKTVQSLLRHSSPDLGQKVYQQAIPEDVVRAVNDYESRVFAARAPKPKLTRVK